MDPDLDFWPIRIRTKEKKSDPDPDKRTWIQNTAKKVLKTQLKCNKNYIYC